MTIAGKPRVVPLQRTLTFGATGRDVTALQRALRAERPAAIDNDPPRGFGPDTRSALRNFQQRHGLHVDGVYGPATHKKLAPWFDQYGAWLMGLHEQTTDPEQVTRAAIVAAATLGYNNREAIHYTQGPRRMEGVTQKIMPPRFPEYADCSSFATWCYFTSGADDPNGLGYSGLGYTGTLAMHGKVVQIGDAKPGDLILYGQGAPWEHVAIYVGNGRVISHGSEGGPYLLSWTYRSDFGQIRTYF